MLLPARKMNLETMPCRREWGRAQPGCTLAHEPGLSIVSTFLSFFFFKVFFGWNIESET